MDDSEVIPSSSDAISERRDGDGDGDSDLEDVLDVDADDLADGDVTDIVLRDHPAVSEILADIRNYFASTDSEEFAGEPSDEFIATRFFDFSFLDEYELVEYRWVREPFALVALVYDEDEFEHRYHVSEPVMNQFEDYVLQDMIELLRNQLMYKSFEDEDDRREVFEREAETMILENAATVDPGSLHKLLYYLIRNFIDFGPIDPIMRDPAVEDVSCDGTDVPIFVYHQDYRDLKTNITFDRQSLDSFSFRMAQRAGKQLTVSSPLVDATLPNGSRVQITLGGDVSTRGSNFTIRKFADIPFTPVDLIQWNTFSAEMMAYYWIAIQNNKSLVFAGGTGSGKTSSMNAISFFIPPRSKIVSIEDTREIDLPHENWVQSVTREGITSDGRGEVSMYSLLRAALRQRPEYLLVGEIRTDERVALTFFQAMSTGHTAYTTLHADSVDTVISRLQNPPLNVPVQMLRDLDVISVQQQTFKGDERVRRNRVTSEILPQEYDASGVQTREIFRRDASTDTHEQVSNSALMEEIAEDRGWSEEDLERELGERRALLEYLAEEGISGYLEVTAAIRLYDRKSELIMDRIEDGTLTAPFLRESAPDIGDLSSRGVDLWEMIQRE